MTIMDALRIMAEHFEDDTELGSYIRMLTDVPLGSIELDGHRIEMKQTLKHFADNYHENGDISDDSLSFEDLLKNIGLESSGKN